MKPGVEVHRTGVLPHARTSSVARARTASEVCAAVDDLDQAHQRRRVEEVQAEHPLGGRDPVGDGADVQAGGVAREQRVGRLPLGPARRTAPAWRRGPRGWPRSRGRTAGRSATVVRDGQPGRRRVRVVPADPALVGEPAQGRGEPVARARRRLRGPRRRGGRGSRPGRRPGRCRSPWRPSRGSRRPVREQRWSCDTCLQMCRRTVRRRYDRTCDDHRHRCRAPADRDPPRDPRAGAPGPRRAVVLLALPRVPVAAGLRRGRRRRGPGRLRGAPRRGLPRRWPASRPTAPWSATRSRRTAPRCGSRYPRLDVDAALAAARAAMPAWRDAGALHPCGGLPRDRRRDQQAVASRSRTP